MAWTTEQTITLKETVSVVTKKTTFTLTTGSSSAPTTSWGGVQVLEDMYFKVSNLISEKNDTNYLQWRMSSLKVKESNGRTITIGKKYSKDNDGYIELLKDKDELIDSNFEFQVVRNENDYGAVSLDFKYVWYNTEHTSTGNQIGAFSYQSEEKYVLNYEIEDDYKEHICSYTTSSSTYGVLFFDQTIPIKYNVYLNEQQLWRPKVALTDQVTLTNINDSSLYYTSNIVLNNGSREGNYVYFNIELKTENFIDSVFPKDENNKAIIEPLSLNKLSNKILIHFSKNPTVVWNASSSYSTCSATVQLNHPNGNTYNCPGTFKFYEQDAPTDYLVTIDALQYFFKGIGFYYNFERGITQNQFYYNMPYWFYLFQSSNLTDGEIAILESQFFRRDPWAGEENLENANLKKKENACFSQGKTQTYLFKRYAQNLPGITIVFSGTVRKNDELPYTDHFFQEKTSSDRISCYDSQTVLIWYKGEDANLEHSKITRRNQKLDGVVTNRYFSTTDTVFINDVAIKPQFQTLLTYCGSSMWDRYVITSNFSINLIERNVLNNNLIKKTAVQLKDISEGENYTDLLTAFLAKQTIILSDFNPSQEKIYSIEFSITLQNLEQSQTFQNECCFWIPFQYTFSTEKVYLSYEPQWVEKEYSINDQYQEGLYRKEQEGTIFRTPRYLELQEGDIYYECRNFEGGKSAFYDQANLSFFPNYVHVPFICSIPLNLFFSLQNEEGVYNYNVLLNKLKDTLNQKIVSFPTFGAGLVEYKQQGLNDEQWIETNWVFSKSGLPGSLIETRKLSYTFPQEIVSSEEFNSNMILSASISSPLGFTLQRISPSYPVQFRSDLDIFYIEWEYPPLGKIPTVAYRKNRIGINSLRVDDEENQILIMEQISETEARYITFYNHEGKLTFQVDLQTGNFYFSGTQMSDPLI